MQLGEFAVMSATDQSANTINMVFSDFSLKEVSENNAYGKTNRDRILIRNSRAVPGKIICLRRGSGSPATHGGTCSGWLQSCGHWSLKERQVFPRIHLFTTALAIRKIGVRKFLNLGILWVITEKSSPGCNLFKAVLEDVEDYKDLIQQTEVRWLGKEMLFARLPDLMEEIKEYLKV